MFVGLINTDATQIPDNEYVLIQVANRPWHDRVDQAGCFWKTARRDSPGSNRLKEFGPGSYNIDEITAWTRLPHNLGV